MHALVNYAFVPVEKRTLTLVDDVLRHRLASGKVPGRVFRLVGTAAGGNYACRYLRCTRKRIAADAAATVSARYSRRLSGPG